MGSFFMLLRYRMKFAWFYFVPVVGFSPVLLRYLRIQGKTNPFLKEVCFHTAGKVVSSLVPEVDPLPLVNDALKDTVYECVENRTILLEYFAKHLVIQMISHEISDGVHEVVKKIHI
jgi:hypothetical protein